MRTAMLQGLGYPSHVTQEDGTLVVHLGLATWETLDLVMTVQGHESMGTRLEC